MTVTISIDENNVAEIAKSLQKRFREIGIDVKLGQAYDAVAAMAGFRNWHVMKAALQERPQAGSGNGNLAKSLALAAEAGMKTGAIAERDARRLKAASEGDPDSLRRLGADCGLLPFIFFDIEEELARQRKIGSHMSRDELVEFSLEYSANLSAGKAAYSDFFADWLHDRQNAALKP